MGNQRAPKPAFQRLQEACHHSFCVLWRGLCLAVQDLEGCHSRAERTRRQLVCNCIEGCTWVSEVLLEIRSGEVL